MFPVRQPTSSVPALVMHDDLCRAVFASQKFGQTVRVVLRYPPVATADSLVWEYRPGWPPSYFAPTIRMVFESSIQPIPSMVVEGIVSSIEPDDRPRKSRLLGVVVMVACRPVPASP